MSSEEKESLDPTGDISSDPKDSSESPVQPEKGTPSEDTDPSTHEGTEPSEEPDAKSSYYDDHNYDESDHLYDDQHADDPSGDAKASKDGAEQSGPHGSTPPPSEPPVNDENDDDDMARMSFLEHLEELRTRLLRGIGGLLVVYLVCLTFAKDLLAYVLLPFNAAAQAIAKEGEEVIRIINIRPLEQFQVVYIKVPLVAAVFAGSPWIMYQAWKFIAPGLYHKEKRWAVPFIFTTATLFILGGMFCYFIALRVTLQFLLTVSSDQIDPMISVSEYLNTFIILEIGLGIVFQLPVLIFFFTLLRLTTPRFLLRNVRYAVLLMFVVAAIITPTGDPITMTLFAGPMILLYFVGIGASWLLVLRREGRSLPWFRIFLVILLFAATTAGIVTYMYLYQGYGFTSQFPWFGLN